jgi:hypothetical protein
VLKSPEATVPNTTATDATPKMAAERPKRLRVRFDSEERSWWIVRMLPFSPEKGTTGKLTTAR